MKKRNFSDFIIICLLIFADWPSVYSQRRTETGESGASMRYIPINQAGNPDCGYLNSQPVLFFSDEFNSAAIDTSKWILSYPWGLINTDSSDSWCNEQEILTENGNLRLGVNYNPRQISVNSLAVQRDFSIGAISSKHLFGYGYYEIRCRIPRIAELWPAFWLYGDCEQEIDIFEFTGSENKRSNKKLFHDKLSVCAPHRDRWYVPQECASANPVLSYHSAVTNSVCSDAFRSKRSCSRKLFFSDWHVKKTPLRLSKGCVYYDVAVDLDFHLGWHTFGLSYTPEGITWFIDSIPVLQEHRYFLKSASDVAGFKPCCLSDYCSNTLNGDLYEQVNLPSDKIGMRIIINNNHQPLPEYNLVKWVRDNHNWSDGYFEIDYIRYYKFSSQQHVGSCNQKLLANEIFIFPSINNGSFHVTSANSLMNKTILIRNFIGQTVYTASFFDMDRVFQLSLETGVYVATIFCEGRSANYKLIIQKD